jgi:hypothetical protein
MLDNVMDDDDDASDDVDIKINKDRALGRAETSPMQL